MLEVRNFPLPRVQSKGSTALYTLNVAVSDSKGWKKRKAKETFDEDIKPIVESLKHLQFDQLHLTCRFYFATKHRRDGDNMIYFLKFLADALVKAGIIKDDSLDILTHEFRLGAFGTREEDYASVEFSGRLSQTDEGEQSCRW